MTMETKKCPFCAEEINIDAIKCKHCCEYFNKSSDYIEKEFQKKQIEIPKVWKKIKNRFIWIVIVIIFGILKSLFKGNLDHATQSEIEQIFSLLSSIIEIGAVFYTYLLVEYIKNYYKEIPIFKIYFWVFLISVLFDLWLSINDISENPIETGAAFVVIFLLLVILLFICQFIASRSLIKIKNDNIGGLKTIGTSLFIFAFINIFLLIIMMIMVILVSANEEYQGVVSSSSPTTTIEIIGNLISIAFSFIFMYLVNQTLRKAEIYNNRLIKVNDKVEIDSQISKDKNKITKEENKENNYTSNPIKVINTIQPNPLEDSKIEFEKEIQKEKSISILSNIISKLNRNKKTILYIISAILLCFLSVYLFKKLKPIDYANPEAVLKEYRKLSTSNIDFEKIYDKLLSDESKKLLNRDEFVKIKTPEYKGEIKYLESVINQLPLDNNNSTFRRFTVKEKKYTEQEVNELFYYTLKNEDGKWKIVWTGKLKLFGDDQYSKGDYTGAIKTYEKIVAIDPYNASAYSQIANCYRNLEKNDDCLKYCKPALTLEPENIDVYISLAGYYGKIGNSQMGIQYLERGLSHCLNDWDKSTFYSNISAFYLTLKDFQNANNYAKSAISSDSTYTFSWFILGKIKHTENNLHIAKEYYQKAIMLSTMEPQFQFELYANYANICLLDNECDSAKKYSLKALDLFPESKPIQEINEKAQNCNEKKVECSEKEEKIKDSNDPKLIKTCIFEIFKCIREGTADYKGRYSYSYKLFKLTDDKYKAIKNSELFNENKNNLLAIINQRIKKDFNESSKDPYNEGCFDGKTAPTVSFDDLEISFNDVGIDFSISFGLGGACMAADGTTISFKIDDIKSYLNK